MTRYARAGNTQKHCKQPEDPTPWKNLSSQVIPKKKQEGKKFQHGKIAKPSNKKKRNTCGLQGSLKVSKKSKEGSTLQYEQENEETVTAEKSNLEATGSKKSADINANVLNNSIAKDITCVVEDKEHNMESDNFEQEILTNIGKNTSLFSKGKKKKKKKRFSLSKNIEHSDSDQTNLNVIDSNEVVSVGDTNGGIEDRLQHDETSEKISLKKKRNKNRSKNGILLPTEVEDKQCGIKTLGKEGISGDKTEKIIWEKIKVDPKFRKSTKICFSCREYGHVLAECPVVRADKEQGTGICFKCGSTDHTSVRCKLKTNDFPYAKCFICKNMGHLSRNCPENKLGVFPKGGKCNFCGDINHMKKDCPRLTKKKDEVEIYAHTIDQFQSMDAEYLKPEPVVQRPKKAKVVKF